MTSARVAGRPAADGATAGSPAARYRRPSARTAGIFAAVLGLAYVALVAATVAGAPVWFFAAAAASYVADAVVLGTPLAALLRRWQVGVTFRFLFRELLLVTLYARHGHPTQWSLALLLVGLGGVHAARVSSLYLFSRARRTRSGLLRWTNLDVDGQASSPVPLRMVGPSWPPLAGTRLPLHFDLAMFVAVALAWRTGRWALLVAVLVVAAAGALLLRAGMAQYLTERRQPSAGQRNEALMAALVELAPQVVVYFSSAVTSTYALNVWLETVDHFDRPCVIFLREFGHLAKLGPTRTPVVVLPSADSVARHQLQSMRVALYPTTVVKNNHMLRLVGMRHVFINHGDGDKSVTYSPLHRTFDEVWVAGEAARDRYLTNDVGVRDDQIKLVGRPQLAHIESARTQARAPFTVLYAPTWEGNFDGVDYSSVASMGPALLQALLTSPLPVTVLLKPHPATGQRSAAARRARARLEQMIRDAGGEHRLVDPGPEALYTAFNDSDLLIADVSSVVADYLASRKPYVVTNPRGLDPDTCRRELPSTSGGHLLDRDLSGLGGMLSDSFGPDSLRQRREELATYFLGEPSPDPVGRFVGYVDAAVDAETVRQASAAADATSPTARSRTADSDDSVRATRPAGGAGDVAGPGTAAPGTGLSAVPPDMTSVIV